jgi:DedD protein
MDPQLKQRVVGAAVLVAVGVMVIPLFLDRGDEGPNRGLPFDVEITRPADFSSRVVPLDDDMMTEVERAMDATPEELAESADWGDETLTIPEQTAETSAVQPPAIAAVTAPRTGVTAWVVQLGSFSSEANAIGLVERLKKEGYAAFIEPLHDDGKVAYRVRVGPELTKETADQVRDKLKKDVDIKGIVMRYP